MRIVLGHHSQSKAPVVWDSRTLINPHLLMVGKSGTGKTHSLRRLIGQLQSASQGRMRVHVLDVHGDIDIPGASSVKFSESTSYGFNPLVINPDPDFGGVRKRIQSFLGALARTGYRLGARQEAALRNLLYDLYAANGFRDGEPRTWHLQDGVTRAHPKKNPTMDDAVRFAQAKARAMFLGTDDTAVAALEKLNRKQARWHTVLRQSLRATGDEREALDAERLALIDECTGLYREHMEKLGTGHELDDLLKYDSREVMRSVVDRLENLRSIGIFRPQRPPFDLQNPVWHYNIRALARDEQKLFVSFILEAIFLASIQRGPQEDLRELIVLDEAHLFVDDVPDNPINVIAKEARKFGLGLFAASQSPTHFSDDFLTNCGTKLILGIDEGYWGEVGRRFRIDIPLLEWIIPRERMVAQMNELGKTRNLFLRVDLNHVPA